MKQRLLLALAVSILAFPIHSKARGQQNPAPVPANQVTKAQAGFRLEDGTPIKAGRVLRS